MSPSRSDRLLPLALRGTALVAGGVVVLVFAFLVLESVPALVRVGPRRLLLDPTWHPLEGSWGLLPMIAGSLLVTALAVLLGGPWGILCATCCRFLAPPAASSAVRRAVELLAGIPSVVLGFWGLVVLVPLVGAVRAPGTSLLAGGLVLAVMIFPTVALLADGALGGVPRGHLAAAAALGLSRRAVVLRVALPVARRGLAGAVLLGTARALSETMAVMMVCGNVARLPRSVFDPVRTLTANIALEMSYALGVHRSALFASGLLLALLAALLVGIAARAGGADAR